MARVTSSPAAQQPKETSHSAQASTALVRVPNATTSSPSRAGCRQSPRAAVGERYGPPQGPPGLSQVPVTLGQRSNRFPED
jgi:hypothetical protein